MPWAAHSYNVAFDDEIGHFDYCSKVTDPFGSCTGREGTNREAADSDDSYCFPASSSTLVRVSGCLDTNSGFDGESYRNVCRTAISTCTRLRWCLPARGPAPTTPRTAPGRLRGRPARIEDPSVSPGNNCDRSTGAGCTRIPLTDDHTPANFYPYFSSGSALGGCAWTIGQDVPGFSVKDYGKNNLYGLLRAIVKTCGSACHATC